MKKKQIDIMLPVYRGNLHEIPESIEKQVKHFSAVLKKYDWKIVLAINGKNAGEIIALAERLGREDRRIAYDYVEQPGKGSGIGHSWSRSKADIMTYMDIDLSTDIEAFPNLVAQIENGYEISIASRYLPESVVVRSLKRKIVSVGYHKFFMKYFLGAKRYTDAQCGFKAVSRKVVEEILPLVRNRYWFFESEMLYIAQLKGFKIKEIPVKWIESEFSGVALYKAILEFIKCGIALRFRKINGKTRPEEVQMSSQGDWLQRIKEKFKAHPRLYYWLVDLVSPTYRAHKNKFKRLLKVLPSDAIIVNLGSGPLRLSKRVYNIDLIPYKDVDIVANILKLPFKDHSVEGAISVETLEHIPGPLKAVSEIRRILKPSGLILSVVPFMEGYHASPFDYTRWTKAGVLELFGDFEMIEIGVGNGPTSSFLWMMQEWLATLLSFNIYSLYKFFISVLMIVTSPLKLLDLILHRYQTAENIAGNFYFFGRKMD